MAKTTEVDGFTPMQHLTAQLQLSKGLDVERAKTVVRLLEPMFAQVLPQGTSVVVDLRSRQFVHAAQRSQALKLFIGQFGEDAAGWTFEVGVPMTIGAGNCPK